MQKKLLQFLAKWNNQPADFDNAYGNQCFDLYRFYCQEVLNIPQSPPTGDRGAVAIWDTYLSDHLDRIEKNPNGVPNPGDIIIWDKGIGQFGHVAVYIGGNTSSFVSFDQNYPVGSLCHLQKHNYNAVLGWLRPKSVSTATPQPEVITENTQLLDLRDKADEGIRTLEATRSIIADLKRDLSNARHDATIYLNQLKQCQESKPVPEPITLPQPPQNPLSNPTSEDIHLYPSQDNKQSPLLKLVELFRRFFGLSKDAEKN